MAGLLDHSAVTLGRLFSRQNECLSCADQTLICPNNCKENQQCQFTVQTCKQCPQAYCAAAAPTPTSLPTTASTSSGPNPGVIAGGVVGGVAVMAVITYLVWRFSVKNKRRPEELQEYEDDPDMDAVEREREKSFTSRRDQRASTHTAHSIASTVLTRASNIIQIAYIPGVTNRATPTSPTLLVPPVPPIPMAVSSASTPADPEEQHFFVPGDLRDSTYSGLSGYTDRTSYARTSYAPRSSVASTIYAKNAVIAAPAQTGMMARPAVVSVKSAVSPGIAPPVPNVDYEKYNGMRPPSPSGSTFSVGSTFLNNASAATAVPVRPNIVRVGSGGKKIPSSPLSPNSPTSPARASRLVRDSNAVTIIEEESPLVDQGPFSDPAAPRFPHQSTTSLSAVIEEATRRASQRDATSPLKGRERSPFGDENATHDN